ncbi:CHAT domain-containing protein [Granulosicoccus sp.]|nr:CHAT domain-containing protein [Granulosicoccus sp.]MDB4222936.1 CHAT domain-containing protein [Granulosicoccus sp.]
MRVAQYLFIWLSLFYLLASNNAYAQESSVSSARGAVIQNIVESRSLSQVVSDLRANVNDCTSESISGNDRLICILSDPSGAIDQRPFLLEVLGYYANKLQNQPITTDSPEEHFIVGASSIALLRADAPSVGTDEALLLARPVLDQLLLDRSSRSTNPGIHNVSVMMYAEMYLVEQTTEFIPRRAAIWLTNLGTSLARLSRHTQDRVMSAHGLEESFSVRQHTIKLLETLDDPVALARAHFNLGNALIQAGEWVDPTLTATFVDRAAKSYQKSIAILADKRFEDQATANRLLTISVAMNALVLPRGSGDNYLAHRRGIGMIKFLREQLPDRVSSEREVDLFLSELGLRTQLISRLATDAQRLAQIKEALKLLDKYAATASEIRPEPDTSLSIGLASVTLYAERGRLTGNTTDCSTSHQHWQEVAPLIPKFPGTAGGGRAERSLLFLIDCEIATDPLFEHAAAIRRIAAKREKHDRYLAEFPFLEDTPPLYASEVKIELRHTSSGDDCVAAESLQSKYPQSVLETTPEFLDLYLVGFRCRDDLPGQSAFITKVREDLQQREQSAASSRSGLAFVSRGLRQDLTDYALELANQGVMDEAYWVLDFRDRSRFASLVEAARDGIETEDSNAVSQRERLIASWLKSDNPSDLEAGYAANGFESGQITLTSEVASRRLDLTRARQSFDTPDTTLAQLEQIGRDRTLAYLLIGENRAGWLVSGPNLAPVLIEIPMRRSGLKAILDKRFSPDGVPTDQSLNFFNSREALTQQGSSVDQWHAALDGVSASIAPQVIAPLMTAIAHDGIGEPPILTIIVRNELADLPLHAISIADKTACGRALIDCFAVTYSADVQSLARSQIAEPIEEIDIAAFWGFSDSPAGTGVSLNLYRTMFEQLSNASVETAPNKALSTLNGAAVGLWVVHGHFNASDPMQSTFELAEGESLSPIDILSQAPIPKARRLQILIGCDGALFDTIIQPTEQTGLAEPFLQLGIPATILPNWESEQVASMLFSQRLISELNQGVSPAQAYRTAIRFLRDANAGEIVGFLDPDLTWLTPDTQVYKVIARLISKALDRGTGGQGLFGHLSRFAAFKLVEATF